MFSYHAPFLLLRPFSLITPLFSYHAPFHLSRPFSLTTPLFSYHAPFLLSRPFSLITPLFTCLFYLTEVAEVVFNRCTTSNTNNSDDPDYTLTFDYELLDDAYLDWKVSSSETNSLASWLLNNAI